MKVNGTEICPKDCPDRDAYCHSNCEQYLQFHWKRQEEYKWRKAVIDVNDFVDDSIKHKRNVKRTNIKHYRPKENR